MLQKLLLKSPFVVRTLLINVFGYFLARNRFSKKFWQYLEEYQFNLSKTSDQIENEQFQLLKNTLIYSYENIPYYRKLFGEVRFDPYKMTKVGDIKVIPVLTKDIIRKEFKELQNSKISKNLIKNHSTSGSTGEKLNFLIPKELMYSKNTALLYRFYGMAGIKPKERRVTIGGRKFSTRPPHWVYNKFENQLLISAHHLQYNYLRNYLDKIIDFKPSFIQGHPSAILILAKFIEVESYEFNHELKAILTTGESLTEDDRKTIQRSFKAKVYQQYGAGENAFSAQEAPDETGYLINYEHGFVELLGEGNYKEVVVTSLQNDVMPFIRYKVGDLVLPVEPHYSEKYGLPILFKEVLGRTDDIIEGNNGEQILPVTLRNAIKPLLKPGTNYQLIQITSNEFDLLLIDEKKLINIQNFIQTLLVIVGNDANFNIKYVSHLTSQGGKIRNIIKQK